MKDRNCKFCDRAESVFLAILKCNIYLASYAGIIFGVNAFHKYIVIFRTGITPDDVGSRSYIEFYKVFSERYCEYGILAAVLVLLAYFTVFSVRHKNMVHEIRLNRIRRRDFLLLAVAGVSAQAVVSSTIVLFYTIFPDFENYFSNGDFDILFANSNFLMQFLFVAVITPVLEETVFRGIIYVRLKRSMPTLWASILSAIAFGTAHGNFGQFLYAFLLGIICAVTFEKLNSLLASFAVHFAFNAGSFFVRIVPKGLTYTIAMLCISLFSAALLLVYCTDKQKLFKLVNKIKIK